MNPIHPNPGRGGPLGQVGVPWGEAERAEWRGQQTKQRSYDVDVVRALAHWYGDFEAIDYGVITYDDEHFPLRAVRSRRWVPGLPGVLVTGGVHGYETSGVHGALGLLQRLAQDNEVGRGLNWLVVPCVSPWAYERIHRWNRDAVDPNRSFREPSVAPEAAALMAMLKPYRGQWAAHIDLHETTDSDETTFRPALAARDGQPHEPGTIPDGFYLVDDLRNPQPAFQRAILAAVEPITHIAEADDKGELIGSPMIERGVIAYDFQTLGLCAGITGARWTSTTEVYPDSARTSPEECVEAQIAAALAAMDFVLEHTA
ncbi:MAG: M14 family zinc carboxypeptidase [Burkholderiaceae bacterium]